MARILKGVSVNFPDCWFDDEVRLGDPSGGVDIPHLNAGGLEQRNRLRKTHIKAAIPLCPTRRRQIPAKIIREKDGKWYPVDLDTDLTSPHTVIGAGPPDHSEIVNRVNRASHRLTHLL